MADGSMTGKEYAAMISDLLELVMIGQDFDINEKRCIDCNKIKEKRV